MSRLTPWLLVALLAILQAYSWLRPRPGAPHVSTVSTTLVRDSARVAMDTAHARHEVQIKWLARAPADTLGPILRALARRPPLVQRDTIYLLLDTAAAGDSGSPEPCDISVSCQEARRLLARDTSWSLLADSIRWEDRIKSARGDSLEAHLSTCLAEKHSAYGHGFLLGSGTGLGVCASLEAILKIFF